MNIQEVRNTIYRIKSRYPRQTWRRIGVTVLIVALLLTSCISIASYASMHSAYTSARNGLGERLYTYLYMMTSKYGEATLAGADIENAILPSMKEWFRLAVELNSYMSEAFGSRYTLLTSERIATINAAFDQYETAFRTRLNVDDAATAMAACMNALSNLLNDRYTSGTRLLPN